MKDLFLGLVSTMVALIALLIGGELVVRAYHLYLGSSPGQQSFSTIQLDEKLGWRPTPNYHFIGERKDAGGESYSVDIQTNTDGFRIFGDPREKTRKKVLIIGDSFTHAVDVSNDKTYYGILNNMLPIEVFAIGVEGYGTLQEYMMLDSVIDQITPDIVLLQFCSNDFINNSYDLEFAAKGNNNGMRRPYFTEDGIVYRIPKNFSGLREFAYNYSRFLYTIIKKLDRINAQSGPADLAPEPGAPLGAEKAIKKLGFEHPPFKKSVEITDQLVGKIRQRVSPTVPIYAFSDNHSRWYYRAFKKISRNNGITFIEGVPEALSAAKQNGITTRAADKAHWNNAGHQIVADVLAAYIEKNWL